MNESRYPLWQDAPVERSLKNLKHRLSIYI